MWELSVMSVCTIFYWKKKKNRKNEKEEQGYKGVGGKGQHRLSVLPREPEI